MSTRREAHTHPAATLALAAVAILTTLAACASPPGKAVATGTVLERRGQEIVVCGQLVHVGVPVVLWFDPGGYDAYRPGRRFVRSEDAGWEAAQQAGIRNPARYDDRGPHRDRRAYADWTLDELRDVVDQFVLHYDAAGTSRRCFQILHDVRGLSVHFLLDLDGTIYQTLDVKERAWHATIANSRSVGVEIANIGAYPPDAPGPLDEWYARDPAGSRIRLPDWMGDGGLRTPGFVARPARDAPITGSINGRTLVQHDFTPEQYHSLARLAGALHATLPAIRLDAPRDAHGRVLTRTLSPDEFASFSGILGHYHVQTNKIDPGPALDWERLLREARALRAH